mgnify:CR=1 FL=1
MNESGFRRENQYEGEDRILVPSPKVETYDLKPEMSAYEVTEKVLAAIKSEEFEKAAEIRRQQEGLRSSLKAAFSFLSVLYYEGIKICFESILGCQTGITKIIFLASPFLHAAIIVHFHVILDHERHNSVSKTFFIKDQSSKKVLGNFGFLFGFSVIAVVDFHYLFSTSIFSLGKNSK